MYYILKERGIIKHFAVYPGVVGSELISMAAGYKGDLQKGGWSLE
jgi:hypothetical protein